MPTYESWKYCGQIIADWPARRCGNVAQAECSGVHHPGIPHAEEVRGWAEKPKEVADHPRFVCGQHRVDD